MYACVRPYMPMCAHIRPHTRSWALTLAYMHPSAHMLMPMCGIVILRVGAGLSIAHVAAQHRTDGQEVGAPAIAHNASAATPTTRRDGQECRP